MVLATSSLIIWELVGDANYQAPPQIAESKTVEVRPSELCFKKLPPGSSGTCSSLRTNALEYFVSQTKEQNKNGLIDTENRQLSEGRGCGAG